MSSSALSTGSSCACAWSLLFTSPQSVCDLHGGQERQQPTLLWGTATH